MGAMAAILMIFLGAVGTFSARVLPDLTTTTHGTAQIAARTISLVSFNVSMDNTSWREAADWLLKTNPDFVILLEATKLAFPLIGELQTKYPYLVDCLPAETICPTLVLSKTPPLRSKGLASIDPFDRQSLSAAFAVFGIEGRQIGIVATHLSRPKIPALERPWNQPGKQVRDISDLTRFIHSLKDDPIYDDLIVAGDFNLTPWSVAMRRLDQTLGPARVTRSLPTWPALRWTVPILPIDHAFLGAGLTVHKVSNGPALGSDHIPIVIELSHRNAAPTVSKSQPG